MKRAMLLCGAILAIIAVAQDRQPNLSKSKKPVLGAKPGTMMEVQSTISRMAEEGVRRKDPSYLMGATQLRCQLDHSLRSRGVSVQRPKGKTDDQSARELLGKAVDIAVKNGDRNTLEAAADLAESKRVGLGDTDLATKIRGKIKNERGAKAQPARDAGRLGPNEQASYVIPFEGTQAAVVIATQPGAKIELSVLDEHSGLIARTISKNGAAGVSWSPRRPGDFKIVVRNASAKFSCSYTLEAK